MQSGAKLTFVLSLFMKPATVENLLAAEDKGKKKELPNAAGKHYCESGSTSILKRADGPQEMFLGHGTLTNR